MKELRRPNSEELENLKEVVVFNSAEQEYWDDMIARRDSELAPGNHEASIGFYFNELKQTQGKFGGRVAVKRTLEYLIGHAHEWLGTYTSEGQDFGLRAEMCEKAVLWYQRADETIGFLSDYALRQAEASGMVAKFRTKAGLNDNATAWYAQRFGQLIGAVLGPGTAVQNGAIPENLKRMADATVDSVAQLYLFRDKAPEGKLN